MYDSQKVGKPLSLEHTENFEGKDFHMFMNDHNDQGFDSGFGDDSVDNNFKSQTTTIPFHSSLGTDFLNLFANSNS